MEKLKKVPEPILVAAFNPVTYVTVGGEAAEPRRQVVDLQQCNQCHDRLAAHGGVRQNVEYCVLCHNPVGTDEEVRPAESMPPTTIDFNRLIHSIHVGQDRSQKPYIVYGYQGSMNDFSELRFPGDLTDCAACHRPATYNLPLPEGVQPITVTQKGAAIDTILPARAACTGCHDGKPAGGHAELQTTSDGLETCAVCHDASSEFSVELAHPGLQKP